MQNKISLTSDLKNIFFDLKEIFKDRELFLVGGVIRDILLGKKTTDVDLCTDATPEEIKKLLLKFTKNIFEIGKKFGTISCIKDNFTIQITTYRTEVYDGITRKPKVKFISSLYEDLSRRDFTINVLAFDGNKFIDYFKGKNDLQNKIIRFVGNPDERIKEDPLRMLRQLDFPAN